MLRSNEVIVIRRLSRRAFGTSVVALTAGIAISVASRLCGAQQASTPRRIGVLFAALSPESKEARAFREGLRDAGYIEGRDVLIEWRYANGDKARAEKLAAELVQLQVNVIVVQGTLATRAAKRATSMASVGDPVGSGLVSSLAHPGANITGLSMMLADINAKSLQLLKDAIPQIKRVAVLWNPDTPFHPKTIEELKAVARSLSISLKFAEARTSEQLGPAFSVVKRARAQALYALADGLFTNHRSELVQLAAKERLPTIYWAREFAEEGGLMSYGPNYADLYRRAVGYVDKIFRGAKAGDLPIEQPEKFELVVNLKSAQALGITIPESILLRADWVIR